MNGIMCLYDFRRTCTWPNVVIKTSVDPCDPARELQIEGVYTFLRAAAVPAGVEGCESGDTFRLRFNLEEEETA